ASTIQRQGQDLQPRRIQVGSRTYFRAGFLPETFFGFDAAPVDLWIPLVTGDSNDLVRTEGAEHFLRIVVRPVGRATVAQLRALIWDALDDYRLVADSETGISGDRSLALVPLTRLDSAANSQLVRLTEMLSAVALLILFMAASNSAQLLLCRTLDRAPKLAIRRALGATRWQLLRVTSVEISMLYVLAALGALGMLATIWYGIHTVVGAPV